MGNIFFAIWGLGTTIVSDTGRAADKLFDLIIPIQPIQLEDEF